MPLIISSYTNIGVVLNTPSAQNPATVTSTGTISVGSTATSFNGDAVYGTSAAAWTLSNYGTISAAATASAGVDLKAGGSVTNAATAALIAGDANGVVISGSAGTVANLGTIEVTGTAGTAIALQSGGSVTNKLGGQIISDYAGVNISGVVGTVINFGTILCGAGTIANSIAFNVGGVLDNYGLVAGSRGVRVSTNPGTIDNSGTITSTYRTVTLNAGGIVSNTGVINSTGTNGFALLFGNNTQVTNKSSGLISAYHDGIGIFPSTAGAPGILVVTNYGTILSTQPGTAAGTGFSGWAVQVGNNGTGTIDNFGTIASSQTGSAVGGNNGGAILLTGGLVTNEAGGIIDGAGGNAVSGSNIGTGVTISNFGTVENTSSTNSTLYFGLGGVLTNGASGSPGALIIGGRNAVSFNNTLGAAVSFGSVVNSGTIQSVGTTAGVGVYFGQGGTLTNQAGGLITAYGSGISIKGAAGTVTNYGTIAHLGAGTAGEAVYFGAGGTLTNDGLISGARAGTSTANGYPGAVDAHNLAATVVNLGTITNPNYSNGVNLNNGGLLINGSTSLTSATISAAHTGVYMGGTLGVPTAGAIGTIINYGTIEAGNRTGVKLASGGTVVNSGTIETGGVAAGNAVYFSGGGTITNRAGGLITAYRGAVVAKNVAATLANYGSVASTGSAHVGVYLEVGGSVTNASGGVIVGGAAGVEITGGAGTVSNSGTIATTGSLGVGVSLLVGGSTVTNAGTIDGAVGAVDFTGAGNRLIVDPGAAFSGQINGGGGNDVLELAAGSATGTLGGLGTNVTGFDQVAIDPSAVWLLSGANTLASGATLGNAGTLEIGGSLGVGGSVANSGLIDIEGGGRLTLAAGAGGAGSIDFVGAGTLEIDGTTMPANPIDGFLAGDAIDLRNLSFGATSAAGFNAGTQVLTVTGSNGSDALTLGGLAPGAVFAVTSDGAGGSLVTLASPDLINGLGGPAAFGTLFLPRSDDGSSAAISISSVFAGGLDFFGQVYNNVYINTNGNITFAAAFGTFTPSALTDPTITNPIIAPYWADVDTTGGTGVPTGGNATGSNLVYYALDTTNHVLTVTWDDVGYFSAHTDKLDAFQLQLIGQGGGNFDIVFRYQAITWTTGDDSGGTGGLVGPGGTVSRAGYNSGTGTSFELPQSGNQTAMLDLPFTPAPSGTPGETATPGVYLFHVRNGVVVTSTNLFDFLFTYADGKDYYYGTVADDGSLGYFRNQTITTTAGSYTIYAEEGLSTSDPSGTVRVIDYSHSGVGVASPTPVLTAAGQPDGTQGLGSEIDNVQGTDGLSHPFSSTVEPSFSSSTLYGFVFTYADGAAFYSGTVADDGSFGVTPGTRALGNGSYSIFAEGVSGAAAGTVVVNRFTENGTSYIPNGPGAVSGSGGLGSEMGSLTVDGINFSFSDQQEPVLPSTIVTVPPVPPPSTTDVITAELNEVYSEVLGRNPDSSGLATYSAALANGTSLQTIRQTIATSSEAQGDLNALYLQIFGRNIDPAGQSTYTSLLIDGGSLATVQLTIAQSPEAQSDIEQIYQQVLARPADGGGLAAYEGALASLTQPVSINEVRRYIVQSSEARNDLVVLFQNVILRAPVAAELAGMQDQLAVPGISQQTLTAALQTGGAAAAGYTTITAPAGNATLTAQPLTPTLVDFTNPGFGNDTVAGFDPARDAIELAATLVANFTTLQSDMTSTAAGASITLGSHSILISGVAPASLGATNFLFA